MRLIARTGARWARDLNSHQQNRPHRIASRYNRTTSNWSALVARYQLVTNSRQVYRPWALQRWYCSNDVGGMPSFSDTEKSVFDEPEVKKQPAILRESSEELCRQLQMHYEFGEHHKVFKLFKELEDQDYPLDVNLYNWLLNSQQAVEATTKCLEILSEMKQKGVEPNMVTYNTVIKSLGAIRDIDTGWELYQEIKKNRRLKPTIQTYNELLGVAVKARNSQIALDLWQAIRQKLTGEGGIRPNRETFILFIHVCEMVDDAQGALVVLKSAQKNHIQVPRGILELCCDIFMKHGHIEGCKYTRTNMLLIQEQDQKLHNRKMMFRSLPEGLLQRMLCTAAICASYIFAEALYGEITEVYTSTISKHQALMSLLLCYAKGGLIKRAFTHIQNQDSEFVLHPAVRHKLAYAAAKSTLSQIESYWKFVEHIAEKNPPLKVTNVLICLQACTLKGEIDIAYSIYKKISENNLSESPIGLNIMLQGCKTLGQGFRLIQEAQASGIEPDPQSYEHLIDIFILQKELYRAVEFLSQLPRPIRPTFKTFKTLVKALADANEFGHAHDTAKLAKNHGYRESALRKFLDGNQLTDFLTSDENADKSLYE